MRYLFASLLIPVLALPTHGQQRQQIQTAPVEAQAPKTPNWETMKTLRVLAKTNDDFSKLHGELITSGASHKDRTAYRWGGASCPGRNLDEAQVALLAEGLTHKMKIKVEAKNGAGGNLCIVGFTLGY
ncbi:MAG: hypothetical protein AAFR74_06345 [Pseudomonadota bacterium]